MNRKRKLAIVAVVLAVLGVVAALLLVSSDSEGVSRNGSPQPTHSQRIEQSSADSQFAAENVRMLEDALNSQGKAEFAKALVPELRQGEWSNSVILPDGVSLKIDRDTFRVRGDGFATVEASISGSMSAEFVLHLKKAKNHWLIHKTEQK